MVTGSVAEEDAVPKAVVKAFAMLAMNLKFNPGANIAEQNLGSYKASMKKLQHREIANQQALGNQREEEEDNTNQRVFFISVQTQGPTKTTLGVRPQTW